MLRPLLERWPRERLQLALPGKKALFIAVPLILLAGFAGNFFFRSSRPSNLPQITATPTQAEQPTQAPSPTSEALAVAAPTEPQFAPVCQDAPTTCSVPIADILDKFCVNKVPYTLLTFPEGTTFEMVTPRFTCKDEGLRDGNQVVSCSGQELSSFDLKVCNSTCDSTGIASTQEQCPDGYGYDSTGQCCAVVPAPDAGCTVIRVDLRDCSS